MKKYQVTGREASAEVEAVNENHAREKGMQALYGDPDYPSIGVKGIWRGQGLSVRELGDDE